MDTNTAVIVSLAVHPEFRHKGIGRKLVYDSISARRNSIRNAVKIELQVSVKNIPAQTLYLNCGFAKTGYIRNYYENGDDALLMSRDVI